MRSLACLCAGALAIAGCSGDGPSPGDPTTTSASPTSHTSSETTNRDPVDSPEVARRLAQAVGDGDVTTIAELAGEPVPQAQATRLREVGAECEDVLDSLTLVGSGVSNEAGRAAFRMTCGESDYRVGTTLDASETRGESWEVLLEWLPGGSGATEVTNAGLPADLRDLPPLP